MSPFWMVHRGTHFILLGQCKNQYCEDIFCQFSLGLLNTVPPPNFISIVLYVGEK